MQHNAEFQIHNVMCFGRLVTALEDKEYLKKYILIDEQLRQLSFNQHFWKTFLHGCTHNRQTKTNLSE